MKIKKQADIVLLFAQGLKTEEVAEELGMNTRTLEGHIYRIKKEWGAKTLPHLVYIFIRERFIRLK